MPAKLKKVMALTFRVAHIRYLQEKRCPLLVQGQFNPEVEGRGTGYSGRPDYYRACGGERDFFPSSGFYRDRHNNSISNAQSSANLRPTQDRSSTFMYA